MATSKRDKPLTILFDDGYICPKCLGVGIGTKWKSKGAKYCPGCGQRIVFAELDEFRDLQRRAKRIPHIMERSEIIETTVTIGTKGIHKQIAGIYVHELLKVEEQGEQMELDL